MPDRATLATLKSNVDAAIAATNFALDGRARSYALTEAWQSLDVETRTLLIALVRRLREAGAPATRRALYESELLYAAFEVVADADADVQWDSIAAEVELRID